MGGDPSLKVPFHEKLMVGAVAGVIGTMSIFPIDMVKTRLQNQTVGADGTPCHSPIAPPSCCAQLHVYRSQALTVRGTRDGI